MLRDYFPEISAVLAACVFVAGAFVAGKVVGASVQDPCDTYDCWEMRYSELIANKGVRSALTDLKKRYDQSGSARTFCHPLLHVIGAAAAREYGSVSEAYRHGETFCRSGYYHGVLEGVFGEEGGAKLLTQLDSICAEIKGNQGYSYNYFSCVHGIGHGLMAYFDHDLFASLRGCDELTGAWEQTSCHGGVFMENVIGNTPEMPSRFLRNDDPLYPCTAVDARYREQCYLMQTSHMLTIFKNDFGKVFAACGAVEEKFQKNCFQSIGRDISGTVGNSVSAAIELCSLGTGHGKTNCFIGAAADFLQSNGEAPARGLCAEAGEGREMCTRALEEQIRML